MDREFDAQEYHADQSVRPAHYRFEGDEARGWRVLRDGAAWLELGEGYRALDVLSCGVCSTDLARHFLPFPLPQITGHEVVLRDEEGRRYVAEINASCLAREKKDPCSFCRSGLETHCPLRMTIGIDRLPGGFGASLLAPRGALIEVPASLPTNTAVLVEPFAAALHAVETVAPRAKETVAVLGPRRLGMLALAALDSWRRQQGVDFEVVAMPRRAALGDLARKMGADRVEIPGPDAALRADVVIDTTGSPEGLSAALRLARREVHLKSTHGQPAGGLSKLTELVVDELSLARLETEAPSEFALSRDKSLLAAWLARGGPASAWSDDGVSVLSGEDAQELQRRLAGGEGDHVLGRADVAVVDRESDIDAVIRPVPEEENALVRPRGRILLDPRGAFEGELAHAVVDRGLVLSGSRCGDFSRALALLDSDDVFRRLGEEFVTHHFARADLAEAMRVAATPECIKAVVDGS